MNGGHLALAILSGLMAAGATGATLAGGVAYIRACRAPESEEGP